MVKRLISANASDIEAFSKEDLIQSIKASEGRVILSENVVVEEPLIKDITTSEIARSYGADMILLNCFDLLSPEIKGLYQNVENHQPSDIIHDLKKLIGLPIGVNIEPVDPSAEMFSNKLNISLGRQASKDTFELANQLGFDFILLTGNPGTGVTNELIAQNIRLAKKYFNGVIIAGKMHSAGVDEPVVSKDSTQAFIDAGADIILVPAVGTVWGITEEMVKEAVDTAHNNNRLVMSAIGTSQESANPQTIREIGLRNKILGIDIQHIGDANMGLVGIKNIKELSDAIRGERHTVSRFARSINR
ncbi:haloacid dehalogenase-like hydrolase [Vagococcus bubulae]|uniref:PEP phosphonomutase n=1 Tax=Vagococcus bubulae TaxID=1977868 RepID=A0A429ZFH6_9ENTE|nr:haloacid dehalogenase-like hydrolase [Vagococcus bubulae]RST92419.1 PEP phosphonomutase [Vagococcus bubulae]